MQIKHYFTMALTVFVISAIGCTDTGEKETKEGNDRIASENSLVNDLNSNYRINLDPVYDADSVSYKAASWDWTKYSNDDLSAIHGKLANVVGNIGRIIEISQQPGEGFKGDESDLETRRRNAQSYLDSLNSFQSRRH